MSTTQEQRCILLVEDSAPDRQLLKMALQRAEVLVDWQLAESCAGLRQALRAIAEGAVPAPELVILDLRLPDGYSTDLLPELRRVLPSPMPVIVFSTSSTPADRERIAHDPDASYLVKPHSFSGYQEIIEEIRQVAAI